ncbi:hypothetical protein ESY86_17915 [Subsaximicrobium wynnwilliamsii]|uniref:HNH endonuclease n=1 Tax=Subsaximicrobium wynnwilliamsii TaxID=291179 RepID=A0A5C6ZCM5_9FLAO|nr:hypothetical protein [Subsaximicrobium wynnwilliamsii]TXD81525.1 hypothetical protein ESY87_17915 [Subsaximicrobium wynnwilliamsii]TXD87191.1 hypothetical protein ESY86_17915 [Subsaximicrobium wynnwilliamsii]TXE00885.1 hypothetical protein ESY88_18165 [Subsaximicrobium wynnwilliamsii]
MNWRLIVKDKTKQPKEGSYSDWKEQIAKECNYQCIYCSINEAQFGGIDHYHIEHHKPKSISRFKSLEDDICNLFYCCPICNRFKSNDWPNDADDLNIACYPDPSEYDYSELFDISSDNYKVYGIYVSTKYMTERLYLNRPQLLYERRESFLRDREQKALEAIDELLEKLNNNEDFDMLKESSRAVIDLNKTIQKRSKIRPYKLAEIRK